MRLEISAVILGDILPISSYGWDKYDLEVSVPLETKLSATVILNE